MLASQTPPAMPPNKLVKRSASLRGEQSSPNQPSASKIPTSTLRRPATSHQRSATLQERYTRDSTRHKKTPSTDTQWRNFFAPKVASDPAAATRRRNSTGIPNPIKRVYPDRKYRPSLVSAGESVAPANVELDVDVESDSPSMHQRFSSDTKVINRFFSSASPAQSFTPHVTPKPSVRHARNGSHDAARDSKSGASREGKERGSKEKERPKVDRPTTEPTSRRSFSVSDLLPTEAQVWRRPSTSNASSSGKYRRKTVRTSSGKSSTGMGEKPSTSNDDLEPHAKGRDVGVTQTYRRPTTSSSRKAVSSSPLTDFQFNLSSRNEQSPAPAMQPSDARLTEQRSKMMAPLVDSTASTSPQSLTTESRPPHSATAVSELSSNITESDSEVKSGDDEGLDSQGETIYDSVRTRATKSSPGRRGPAIESIFDELPPYNAHGGHTMLKDFLQAGPTPDQRYSFENGYSIIEEEENISTPAKSIQRARSPTAYHLRGSPGAGDLSSSSPVMPSLLDLRRTRFSEVDDDRGSEWSYGDDDDDNQSTDELPIQQRFAHLGIQPDLLSPYPKDDSSSATATPQKYSSNKLNGKDARSSIFDWSEQQPLDKSPGHHSPPRPKTVHGKKDAENRGSRPVGRRAPSGIHARSQSVPVAQEENGKRGQVLTNKFGTWGVGTKGVSEDWDEDFDFDALQAASAAAALAAGDEKRYDSGVGMFVPKAIREQQTNVLANIDLLRDWGLLIEELKELRMRAVAMDLIPGNAGGIWNEIDAMIDLADQESDEHTLAPRYSPPSSPSFNYDAFDDDLPPVLTSSNRSSQSTTIQDYRPASRQMTSPPRVPHEVSITPATPKRPRKDSEAVARSVIEALQQKRISSDPGPVPEARPEKVHFDTATLKRILPYVQDLRDKVKRELREAEGLHTSSKNRGSFVEDPSFSKIFHEHPDSPSMQRKARRSPNATDNVTSDDGFSQSPNEDLAARLRLMMVM